MKSHDALKAEMEAIQKKMIEAKKCEGANASKESKTFAQGVWLTFWMPKYFLAEEEKKR